MGVSSRYKSRHRLVRNHRNKNERLQKHHKCKGTKNALVKKAVPLAYLRGFRLFFSCKSKGASKGQKEENKFTLRGQKNHAVSPAVTTSEMDDFARRFFRRIFISMISRISSWSIGSSSLIVESIIS